MATRCRTVPAHWDTAGYGSGPTIWSCDSNVSTANCNLSICTLNIGNLPCLRPCQRDVELFQRIFVDIIIDENHDVGLINHRLCGLGPACSGEQKQVLVLQ